MTPIHRFAAAVLFALSAALPDHVTAQDAAVPGQDSAAAAPAGTEPAEAASDELPDELRAVFETAASMGEGSVEIARQLSICLRPLFPDSPEHANIVAEIAIDAEGTPGAPVLLVPDPAEATNAHMRQVFRVESALFDCKPIMRGGEPLMNRSILVMATPTEITAALLPDVVFDLPLEAASEDTETALGLDLDTRREVQLRLRVAGFDPGGADGIFGPRTRGAVSEWQEARDFPVSGFLDDNQLEELRDETEDGYAELRAAQRESARSAARNRPRFYVGSDGCVRYSNGRIVTGRSFRCDLRALMQGP